MQPLEFNGGLNRNDGCANRRCEKSDETDRIRATGGKTAAKRKESIRLIIKDTGVHALQTGKAKTTDVILFF